MLGKAAFSVLLRDPVAKCVKVGVEARIAGKIESALAYLKSACERKSAEGCRYLGQSLESSCFRLALIHRKQGGQQEV